MSIARRVLLVADLHSISTGRHEPAQVTADNGGGGSIGHSHWCAVSVAVELLSHIGHTARLWGKHWPLSQPIPQNVQFVGRFGEDFAGPTESFARTHRTDVDFGFNYDCGWSVDAHQSNDQMLRRV